MGAEKRKFHRLTEPFEAFFRPAGRLTEPWKAIKTLNISAGGMRFLGSELFEKGDILELQIKLPINDEPLRLTGTVVWSRSNAPDVTENGVQFNELTAAQQFQIDQLVQFLMKSSPPHA